MALNVLTIAVLIVLVAMIGVAVAFLGMLPGKIAKGRNHPQAEAINVASSEEFARLRSKVESLEKEIRQLGGTP